MCTFCVVFSMICTALFSKCWISSRLGFKSICGISKTIPASKNAILSGDLEFKPLWFFVYRLKGCIFLRNLSKDNLVDLTRASIVFWLKYVIRIQYEHEIHSRHLFALLPFAFVDSGIKHGYSSFSRSTKSFSFKFDLIFSIKENVWVSTNTEYLLKKKLFKRKLLR